MVFAVIIEFTRPRTLSVLYLTRHSARSPR
jgi:hypothetical protein